MNLNKRLYNWSIPHEVLTSLINSFFSIIRHKFGSLRSRKHKGSDENLSRQGSYDRLNDVDDDCKVTLFKRHSSHERLREGTTPEPNETLSTSPVDEQRKLLSPRFHAVMQSGSSVESCSESREHFFASHGRRVHSDSDPETTPGSLGDSRPTSRQDCNSNVSTENNEGCDETNCSGLEDKQRIPVEYRDQEKHYKTDEKSKRKLAKRNSFTDVVKHFFVSKSR